MKSILFPFSFFNMFLVISKNLKLCVNLKSDCHLALGKQLCWVLTHYQLRARWS